MITTIQYDRTPGKERFAIEFKAESQRETYDIGRLTAILELMQAPGGVFTDDGEARLTLVLFDRAKEAKVATPSPASSDEEIEMLAGVCVSSAQHQESTGTAAPGTLSSEACRRIAAILRSMNKPSPAPDAECEGLAVEMDKLAEDVVRRLPLPIVCRRIAAMLRSMMRHRVEYLPNVEFTSIWVDGRKIAEAQFGTPYVKLIKSVFTLLGCEIVERQAEVKP